jgi:23S rRNA pseudouridine2605 synthase
VLEITIHEGRKRQVRRMCEAVGRPVRSLVRIRFGPLELGDLRSGRARRLSAAELRSLAGAAESAGAELPGRGGGRRRARRGPGAT